MRSSAPRATENSEAASYSSAAEERGGEAAATSAGTRRARRSSTKARFSVKFYMVAISFIVFDLETIFLIPWAVQMRELGWSAFVAVSLFVIVLAVGLLYEWKKGGLEWD